MHPQGQSIPTSHSPFHHTHPSCVQSLPLYLPPANDTCYDMCVCICIHACVYVCISAISCCIPRFLIILVNFHCVVNTTSTPMSGV